MKPTPLRADDFPTLEELSAGFPREEYVTVLQALYRQRRRQREDEQVVMELVKRIPDLQAQFTPPYGTTASRIAGSRIVDGEQTPPVYALW